MTLLDELHSEVERAPAGPAPARRHALRRPSGRRMAAVLAAAVLVIALLAFAAAQVDDDTTGLRTETGDQLMSPSSVTTTIATTPAPEATPSPPEVTPPTATTSAPAAGRPIAAATPSPSCRNSTDPSCGPFRWDPAPGANQPLTIAFEVGPAQPRAGEEVTVRVVATDPDAPVTTNGGTYFWHDPHFTGGQIGFPATVVRATERYGPWTPPEPQPGRVEMTFTHTFAQPGTYRFDFKALSGAEDDPGNTDLHPYANNPEVASVEITVGPAADPAP